MGSDIGAMSWASGIRPVGGCSLCLETLQLGKPNCGLPRTLIGLSTVKGSGAWDLILWIGFLAVYSLTVLCTVEGSRFSCNEAHDSGSGSTCSRSSYLFIRNQRWQLYFAQLDLVLCPLLGSLQHRSKFYMSLLHLSHLASNPKAHSR